MSDTNPPAKHTNEATTADKTLHNDTPAARELGNYPPRPVPLSLAAAPSASRHRLPPGLLTQLPQLPASSALVDEFVSYTLTIYHELYMLMNRLFSVFRECSINLSDFWSCTNSAVSPAL